MTNMVLNILLDSSSLFLESEAAIRNAVKLFIVAYNQRQLINQQIPNYTVHFMNIVKRGKSNAPTV